MDVAVADVVRAQRLLVADASETGIICATIGAVVVAPARSRINHYVGRFVAALIVEFVAGAVLAENGKLDAFCVPVLVPVIAAARDALRVGSAGREYCCEQILKANVSAGPLTKASC